MRTILACLVLLGTTAPALAQNDPVVLEGAKVFTGEGAFQDGIRVLLQNGKIRAIGPEIDVPAGAERIDLAGTWITPGLVDANTSLGLPSAHENEESSEVTPHLRVAEAIDPEASDFGHALRNGVTTVYVSPGGKNVFGGLGVVFKTAGEARLVREDAGVRMTLGMMPSSGNRSFRSFGAPVSIYYRRPNNRMGTIWEIRKSFYEALDARETTVGPTIAITPAIRVLIDALDRKIKVRTTARADQDIRTALRLAEEFGLDIVLDGAIEAYAALDYIVAAGFPVVAAAPSLQQGLDNATPHLDTIALLADAGVPVAIQTGQGEGALQPLPLIREAAFAVRGGLKREAALAAITSIPAKILRVDERVGTLAPGKDADVVVWSRHPLSPSSRVTRVFVDGQTRSF